MICTSFLCPAILDLYSAFWVFITECNGEARRQPAENAGVLAIERVPVCGTLCRIIVRRLNVERLIYSLNSKKAIGPSISGVI